MAENVGEVGLRLLETSALLVRRKTIDRQMPRQVRPYLAFLCHRLRQIPVTQGELRHEEIRPRHMRRAQGIERVLAVRELVLHVLRQYDGRRATTRPRK